MACPPLIWPDAGKYGTRDQGQAGLYPPMGEGLIHAPQGPRHTRGWLLSTHSRAEGGRPAMGLYPPGWRKMLYPPMGEARITWETGSHRDKSLAQGLEALRAERPVRRTSTA